MVQQGVFPRALWSCKIQALGGHACRQVPFPAQGSLPGEWFSRGSFPELRALVLSYGPLDTPDLRAPKYGAIVGQLPDVSGGALRNLQVTRPPGPAVVRTQP